MMVGRVIYEDPKEHSMVAPDAPVVLKVENLNAGKMVQDVSFELEKVRSWILRTDGCRTYRNCKSTVWSRSETERKDFHHGQTER